MDKRVQIAAHFNIDPSKQTIGAIEYPETVSVTLAVGDKLDAKKVAFDVAITEEQKTKIDEFMKELILESGRTAKPTNASPAVSTPVPESNDDEEISLF